MKQTRAEKQIIYRAVQDLLRPIVCPSISNPSHLNGIAEPTVMSGAAATMLLDAMTFGQMRLEWDAEDEVRSMMKRPALATDEAEPLRARLEEVANIWAKRLGEAGIGFAFRYPVELVEFHKQITAIGTYLGVDSDIEALFCGVPADDINP